MFAHRDQRLDLRLRRRALGLDLELCQQLVEGFLELPFGAVVGKVGDRLANGVIPAFALNSVTSVGSRGGLTFATMANPESGQNGIYYYGPGS